MCVWGSWWVYMLRGHILAVLRGYSVLWPWEGHCSAGIKLGSVACKTSILTLVFCIQSHIVRFCYLSFAVKWYESWLISFFDLVTIYIVQVSSTLWKSEAFTGIIYLVKKYFFQLYFPDFFPVSFCVAFYVLCQILPSLLSSCSSPFLK